MSLIEANLMDGDAKQCMLLSEEAQGALGLVVDFQAKRVLCKYTNEYVKVARCNPSGILMMCISDWPRSFEEICESTRDREIALKRVDDIVTGKSSSWFTFRLFSNCNTWYF